MPRMITFDGDLFNFTYRVAAVVINGRRVLLHKAGGLDVLGFAGRPVWSWTGLPSRRSYREMAEELDVQVREATLRLLTSLLCVPRTMTRVHRARCPRKLLAEAWDSVAQFGKQPIIESAPQAARVPLTMRHTWCHACSVDAS
jgi:hypothetical protein